MPPGDPPPPVPSSSGTAAPPPTGPEHTRASYELAIDLGADLIEPDVVVSRRRRPRRPARERAVAVAPTSPPGRSSPTAARTREVDGRARHRLVHRGLHPRRAAHPARRRADARAAPAQHRLRRPLRHPHPRRGHRAGPPPVDARAAVRVLAELKTPDLAGRRRAAAGRAGRRRAAPAGRRPTPTGPVRAAVLRRRRCCASCARRLGDDGPRLVQLVDDSPATTRWSPAPGCARSRTYAAGHRAQPGPDPAARRATGARSGVLRPRRRGPPRRAGGLPLDAARGERLPARGTCAAATDPARSGTPSPRPGCCSALGVDGLITDSPDTPSACAPSWSGRAAA